MILEVSVVKIMLNDKKQRLGGKSDSYSNLVVLGRT